MRQHSVPMAFRRGTCQPRTNHALEPRLHPSPSSSRGALPCTHTLTPLHPQPRFGAEHLEATLAEGETRREITRDHPRLQTSSGGGRDEARDHARSPEIADLLWRRERRGARRRGEGLASDGRLIPPSLASGGRGRTRVTANSCLRTRVLPPASRSIATMSGERWIVRDAAGRQVRQSYLIENSVDEVLTNGRAAGARRRRRGRAGGAGGRAGREVGGLALTAACAAQERRRQDDSHI